MRTRRLTKSAARLRQHDEFVAVDGKPDDARIISLKNLVRFGARFDKPAAGARTVRSSRTLARRTDRMKDGTS
jgi:hypothetical protein